MKPIERGTNDTKKSSPPEKQQLLLGDGGQKDRLLLPPGKEKKQNDNGNSSMKEKTDTSDNSQSTPENNPNNEKQNSEKQPLALGEKYRDTRLAPPAGSERLSLRDPDKQKRENTDRDTNQNGLEQKKNQEVTPIAKPTKNHDKQLLLSDNEHRGNHAAPSSGKELQSSGDTNKRENENDDKTKLKDQNKIGGKKENLRLGDGNNDSTGKPAGEYESNTREHSESPQNSYGFWSTRVVPTLVGLAAIGGMTNNGSKMAELSKKPYALPELSIGQTYSPKDANWKNGLSEMQNNWNDARKGFDNSLKALAAAIKLAKGDSDMLPILNTNEKASTDPPDEKMTLDGHEPVINKPSNKAESNSDLWRSGVAPLLLGAAATIGLSLPDALIPNEVATIPNNPNSHVEQIPVSCTVSPEDMKSTQITPSDVVELAKQNPDLREMLKDATDDDLKGLFDQLWSKDGNPELDQWDDAMDKFIEAIKALNSDNSSDFVFVPKENKKRKIPFPK